MDDHAEPERGNVSLPPRLQSPDILDENFVYDEKNVDPIMNMQIALYDILIRDTAKDIERLETRNVQLLDENENTKILLNPRDVETSDEIASLTRLLYIESEKVEDFERKLDKIEKSREVEQQAHLRNIDLSNVKYEKIRVDLTSAIKALNAKMNTLEDYKKTQGALIEKLRTNNETVARKEEDMTQKLDAIDRKFKIDREKLKNEMYSQLLALAGTLKLEISDATALPVQRLMRQNIFMKAELLQIVDEALRNKEDCARMRTMEIEHRRSIKGSSEDERKNQITIKIQQCLLKALKKMHSSMKKRLMSLNEPQEFAQEFYDDLADSVKAKLGVFETRTRKLEVLLHRESIRIKRAKHMKNQTEIRAKMCEEILYDVKYAVACALKMTETGRDILEMSETQLISHLLDLFVRGQTKIRQCLAVALNESVLRPDHVYAKGDLGFEPEHIDLEEFTTRKELSQEQTTEKIIMPHMTAISGALLPTITSKHHELDGGQKSSTTTTEESTETSDKTTPTQTEESSDYREDISEANDSILLEYEETLSAESEEQEEP